MKKASSWKYTSNNEKFSTVYNEICRKISNLLETQLDKTDYEIVIDGIMVKITIDYADKTKKMYTFTCFDKLFNDSISTVIQLVPITEDLPKVLDIDIVDTSAGWELPFVEK